MSSNNDYSNRLRRNATTSNRSNSTSSSTNGDSSSTNNGTASNSRPVRSTRGKVTMSTVDSDEDLPSEEAGKSSSQPSKKSAAAVPPPSRMFNPLGKQTASSSQPTTSASFKPDVDKLAKLESITSLPRAEAIHLLEAANNKLDVAVELHFAQKQSSATKGGGGRGGASGGGGVKKETSAVSSAASSKTTNGVGSKRALEANDDALSNDSNSNMSEDYVRAPIPQRSEKLLDYDPYAVEPQNKKIRSAVFGNYHEYSEQTVNGSHSPTKKSLSQLYRPPIDLLFKNTFEAAKIEGCRSNRWILLNVQDQTEFNCQTLNRDLWRDDTVKEIIKANFIFLQVCHDTVDGKKLVHYYTITSYPYIAILDPRTGEKVLQFKNVAKMDQCMFCEKVTNFLSENELDAVGFEDYLTPSTSKKGENNNDEKEVVQIDDDSSSSSKDVVCINDKEKDSKTESKFSNFASVKSESKSAASNPKPTINPSTSKPAPASQPNKLKRAGEVLDSFLSKKTSTSNGKNDNKDDDIFCTDDQSDDEIKKSKNKKTPNGKSTILASSSSESSDEHERNDTKVKKSDKPFDQLTKSSQDAPPASTKSDSNIPQTSHQPVISRYETPGSDTKDCVVRILYPNGDRLDFCTNGNSKFKLLIEYLRQQGFKAKSHELIERLMPTYRGTQTSTEASCETAKAISNDLSNLAINQSRNLLTVDNNSTLSFKEMNLFPRVFLLLQEV